MDKAGNESLSTQEVRDSKRHKQRRNGAVNEEWDDPEAMKGKMCPEDKIKHKEVICTN